MVCLLVTSPVVGDFLFDLGVSGFTSIDFINNTWNIWEPFGSNVIDIENAETALLTDTTRTDLKTPLIFIVIFTLQF